MGRAWVVLLLRFGGKLINLYILYGFELMNNKTQKNNKQWKMVRKLVVLYNQRDKFTFFYLYRHKSDNADVFIESHAEFSY